MKNFTPKRFFHLSVNMVILAMLLISSCASPQHFSFTAAPPAYQKKKAEITEPAPATAADELLTASTAAKPAVLPEIANATKTKTLPLEKTAQAITAKAQVAAPKQKLTLAQKVILKKLNKQITKSNRNIKDTKDTAAGPVSNRSAIALILIGLIIAIFGTIIGPLYSIGVLVLLVGLVLLVLNYI